MIDWLTPNFPKYLKQKRLESGLTQAELYDLVFPERKDIEKNKSNYISNYENGKRSPRMSTVEKIAKALGCSVSALIYGTKDLEDMTPEEQAEAIAEVQKLAAEEDNDLKNYVCSLVNHRDPYQRALLEDYNDLNDKGQIEASKRIHELTCVPEYRKEDES